MPRRTLEERFWEKVEKADQGKCWEWTASRVDGYGVIWDEGTSAKAHRVAYELLVGPIPDGLQIDHLCRNRACVNPAHLEPVTNRENVLRGVSLSAQNASKTHCVHGHEFTPENTHIPRGHPTHRRCRECAREADRRRYRRKRAAALDQPPSKEER